MAGKRQYVSNPPSVINLTCPSCGRTGANAEIDQSPEELSIFGRRFLCKCGQELYEVQ